VSAVLAPVAEASPWRHAAVMLGVVLAAAVLLYRDTFVAMVGIWWRSDTFAHAFLVLPIALWLVWRQRKTLAPFTPRPEPWLLLPLAAVGLVWLLGDVAGVAALTQLCAVAMLVLAVPAVLGIQLCHRIAFPLGFLLFMVPTGEFLLPTMMEATANFTVAAVSLSGVPVYREGLQFIIPSGSWSVVEACSGVRYLIASFMVGTLFAYLNYRTLWRRWLFVGVSLLVPVVANWLRAYMIVMLGHLSGNTLAVGVDHIIYGWVFFGVVIGLMFFIGARWSEPPAEPVLPPTVPAGSMAAPNPSTAWIVCAVCVAVLALPQALAWRLDQRTDGPPLQIRLPEGAEAGPNEDAGPALTPSFPGAAALASRRYAVADGTVTVHVAYFRRQGYSAKLGSSENALVRTHDKQWNRIASGHWVATVDGQPLTWLRSEIVGMGNASRQRIEARQIFWITGRLVASEHWATVLGALSRLAGQGDDGAVITFYTDGENAATGPRLDAFIARQLGPLRAQLDDVRRSR
jgi:exosortase A